MFFRQMALRPLEFGAPPRAPFHRQARRFELCVQPPPRGVHESRILEGLPRLDLNVRIAEFRRGLRPLREVAGWAGESQIAHPIAAASTLGHDVFHLQRDISRATVHAGAAPLLQEVFPHLIPQQGVKLDAQVLKHRVVL